MTDAAASSLAEFLAKHPHALVLTGAGLSTASGIPDYRGRDGIRRVDPNVTPDNPDGVVGFDGPPFNDGDRGVIDDGPLPPGSPADLDDD